MHSPTVLVCESLTKRYLGPGGDWVDAVADLDITIAGGESLVVIGPNGAGKSTLLRVIAGITAPTSGRVRRARRTTGLIELGAGFEPDLTGRENLGITLALMGFGARERRRLGGEIVEFSGLSAALDRPIKHYSSGMVARLALAAALHSSPELLLIDEVLTVGDAAFQRKSLARISEMVAEGCALVMVTHQLVLARRVADWVLWLEAGHERRRGDPMSVVSEYERHYSVASGALHQDHTQITALVVDPPRVEPGAAVQVRARLATRRRGMPIMARVELRPPVGDDDRWMISRREPFQNFELNVIGRSADHPLVTPDADTAELTFDIPAVPITASTIDVVIVVLDEHGRVLDELGAPLVVGAGADDPTSMPRLLIDVEGPLERVSEPSAELAARPRSGAPSSDGTEASRSRPPG